MKEESYLAILKSKSKMNGRWFGVSEEDKVIDRIRQGIQKTYSLNIDSGNYDIILETVNDRIPKVSDNCNDMLYEYDVYNDGLFPYVVDTKKRFLLLFNGDNTCLSLIKNFFLEPGDRYFKDPEGKTDNNTGDHCIWKIIYELDPVVDYLLNDN